MFTGKLQLTIPVLVPPLLTVCYTNDLQSKLHVRSTWRSVHAGLKLTNSWAYTKMNHRRAYRGMSVHTTNTRHTNTTNSTVTGPYFSAANVICSNVSLKLKLRGLEPPEASSWHWITAYRVLFLWQMTHHLNPFKAINLLLNVADGCAVNTKSAGERFLLPLIIFSPPPKGC